MSHLDHLHGNFDHMMPDNSTNYQNSMVDPNHLGAIRGGVRVKPNKCTSRQPKNGTGSLLTRTSQDLKIPRYMLPINGFENQVIFQISKVKYTDIDNPDSAILVPTQSEEKAIVFIAGLLLSISQIKKYKLEIDPDCLISGVLQDDVLTLDGYNMVPGGYASIQKYQKPIPGHKVLALRLTLSKNRIDD